MKRLLVLFLTMLSFQGGFTQGIERKEAYTYLSIETIRRDASAKVLRQPKWDTTLRMPLPDTFVVNRSRDTIVLFTHAGDPGYEIFVRRSIDAEKWRPQPSYHNRFFFIGTYLMKGLGGMYMSFYVTKDWRSIMQVEYTNPGNMVGVTLFTKDTYNSLEKDGFIIDPALDQIEPERAVLRAQP